MDCIEYDEWKDFYRLEPWGCAVDDDRAAKGINYLVAVNSTDHKWIPTHHIFPRRESDFRRAQQEQKQSTEADEVALGLREFFRNHNTRLEIAAAAEEAPSP